MHDLTCKSTSISHPRMDHLLNNYKLQLQLQLHIIHARTQKYVTHTNRPGHSLNNYKSHLQLPLRMILARTSWYSHELTCKRIGISHKICWSFIKQCDIPIALQVSSWVYHVQVSSWVYHVQVSSWVYHAYRLYRYVTHANGPFALIIHQTTANHNNNYKCLLYTHELMSRSHARMGHSSNTHKSRFQSQSHMIHART